MKQWYARYVFLYPYDSEDEVNYMHQPKSFPTDGFEIAHVIHMTGKILRKMKLKKWIPLGKCHSY